MATRIDILKDRVWEHLGYRGYYDDLFRITQIRNSLPSTVNTPRDFVVFLRDAMGEELNIENGWITPNLPPNKLWGVAETEDIPEILGEIPVSPKYAVSSNSENGQVLAQHPNHAVSRGRVGMNSLAVLEIDGTYLREKGNLGLITPWGAPLGPYSPLDMTDFDLLQLAFSGNLEFTYFGRLEPKSVSRIYVREGGRGVTNIPDSKNNIAVVTLISNWNRAIVQDYLSRR